MKPADLDPNCFSKEYNVNYLPHTLFESKFGASPCARDNTKSSNFSNKITNKDKRKTWYIYLPFVPMEPIFLSGEQ